MIHIQEEKMNEFFIKHHIKGLPFDAVIHELKPGDIGGPHDHPFGFRSLVLKGWYEEIAYDAQGNWMWRIRRSANETFYVPATLIHEIVSVAPEGCWTIILPGVKVQESRFYDHFRTQL